MMNLMANDVNRFDNLQHIHYLWIGVVQTGISTCILWKSFGPACLCGLAVLILFVPFQGWTFVNNSNMHEAIHNT